MSIPSIPGNQMILREVERDALIEVSRLGNMQALLASLEAFPALRAVRDATEAAEGK